MEESAIKSQLNLLSQPSQDASSSISQTEKGPDIVAFEVELRRLSTSAVECDFYARKDSEAKQIHTKILRSQKLFPVFQNTELAKLSVNYFLYFEFYHIAIRMLAGVYLVSWIAFGIDQLLAPILIQDGYLTEQQFFLFLIFFAGICAVIMRHLEIRRLLKSPVLEECQWTEDLFSLIVKHLPIGTTTDEINNYFNTMLDQLETPGRVKYIVILQDYKRYAQLKRKIVTLNRKLDDLNLDKSSKDETKKRLAQERVDSEKQLELLEQELIVNQHFKGKAIVVFDSIQAKEAILRHFNSNIFKRLAVFCCRQRYRSYYLKKNKIVVRAAPEPENVIFENLHYSYIERKLRVVIAYFLSSLFIIVISIVLLVDELRKQDQHWR